MTFHHRIRTIYAKELKDILRDRRTLTAMILVPIVLYPLLMLGSVQAISYQANSLDEEAFVIGVESERHAKLVRFLLERDAAALKRTREAQGAGDADDVPTGFSRVHLPVYGSIDALQEAITSRKINAAIVFENDQLGFKLNDTNPISILADVEEIRGNFCAIKLKALLDRTEERTNRRRLRQQGLPAAFLNPLEVTIKDLSAPPSILGQILPLILILMTITGAIYPAIDLTAGERERGTLESLMVCPVSVVDLIVGKFLVVTTVALMGATLNLLSVSATVYFGGFGRMIASDGGSLPLGKMALILLCLVPFAVLMSAIMLAVCSFARTFKEAQNYVTPVILAVLIPGGIAALPATQLAGVMLVMPVGNMVLLARDLLLGAQIPPISLLTVLVSTTLYAGAAVALAANVFGRESVVFADSGSLKGMLSRSMMRPAALPGSAMVLMVVAVLFPVWFFVQTALSPGEDESARSLLLNVSWLMPVLFVLFPLFILVYWKIDVVNALALRLPSGRHLIAAGLLGLTAWVPTHEMNVLQKELVGIPQAVLDSAAVLQATLADMHPLLAVTLLALVPAVCEELLFRGFLLGGLLGAARKWTAILGSAAVFGVFHFFLFKFPVTALLGVVLAYLCWQSRSILPGIIAHLLHNGLGVLTVFYPQWQSSLGVNPEEQWAHLPATVLLTGSAIFLGGIWLTRTSATPPVEQQVVAISNA